MKSEKKKMKRVKENKVYIYILLAICLLVTSIYFNPLKDVNADGTGGGHGSTYGPSGVGESLTYHAYIYYDEGGWIDENQLGSGIEPSQPALFKNGKIYHEGSYITQDDHLDFWLDHMEDQMVKQLRNDGYTQIKSRDDISMQYEVDKNRNAIKNAIHEACVRALEADPSGKYARVVAIGWEWQTGVYNGKPWIGNWGPWNWAGEARYGGMNYYRDDFTSIFSDADQSGLGYGWASDRYPTADDLKDEYGWGDKVDPNNDGNYIDVDGDGQITDNDTWRLYTYLQNKEYFDSFWIGSPYATANDNAGTRCRLSNGQWVSGIGSDYVNGVQTYAGVAHIYVIAVTDSKSPSTQEYGYGQIKKIVPNDRVPTGAEYTVYTDSDAATPAPASVFADGTVQKFKITSTGYSNEIKFNVPKGGKLTLYVKETREPDETGDFTWNIDPKIYKLEIDKADTQDNPEIRESENTTTEYGYLQIHKDVVACNLTNNPQNVSPEGAKYKVFNTRAEAEQQVAYNLSPSTETNPTAVATLTIGPDGYSNAGAINGKIKFIINSTGINSWETRKVYIVESGFPTQRDNDKFKWDDAEKTKIYEATITKDSTEDNPVMVNSTNCYEEQAWAYVEKTLNVTSQNAKDMNISGTVVYSIKDSTNKEVAIVNVVFSKGEIVKSSPAVKLPVGNYTITEISTPDTIIKNSTPKSFTLTRSHTKDNPYKVSFTNDVVSQIKVHKVSNRQDVANKYPITGAVYTLYTDSNHNNIAKDIYGNNATFTINSQGNSEARLMKAGTYYIKETVIPDNYKQGTITPNPIVLRSGDIKMIEGENVLDPGKGKVLKEY